MSTAAKPAQKRKQISEQTREKLRTNARRLVAEGKWGGRGPKNGETWGQGGRKSERLLPRPGVLIPIVEAMERQRDLGASDDLRRVVGAVPPGLLELDRRELTEAASRALGDALGRKLLPRVSVFSSDGRVELVEGPRGRPPTPGERQVKLVDPRPIDFAHWPSSKVLDLLALLSNRHVYATPASATAWALVAEVVRQVREAAETVLAERDVAEGGT